MKPLIGITCNFLDYGDCPDAPGQQRHMLGGSYIDAVEYVGGVPVMIPVLADHDISVALSEHLDGIIFSGGEDINPLAYGEMPSRGLGKVSAMRDRQELDLVRHILSSTDLPLLAICRGAQVVNVALGGTLYQDHLENGLEDHSIVKVVRDEPSHTVTVEAGSLLEKIVSTRLLAVNSFHHQSVKTVANRLVVTAKDSKGVVEALEMPGRKAFTLAVQWHPEPMCRRHEEQKSIFKALILSAAARNEAHGN